MLQFALTFSWHCSGKKRSQGFIISCVGFSSCGSLSPLSDSCARRSRSVPQERHRSMANTQVF
jgi:hypothetical protein